MSGSVCRVRICLRYCPSPVRALRRPGSGGTSDCGGSAQKEKEGRCALRRPLASRNRAVIGRIQSGSSQRAGTYERRYVTMASADACLRRLGRDVSCAARSRKTFGGTITPDNGGKGGGKGGKATQRAGRGGGDGEGEARKAGSCVV